MQQGGSGLEWVLGVRVRHGFNNFVITLEAHANAAADAKEGAGRGLGGRGGTCWNFIINRQRFAHDFILHLSLSLSRCLSVYLTHNQASLTSMNSSCSSAKSVASDSSWSWRA